MGTIENRIKVVSRPPGDWCSTLHLDDRCVSGVLVGSRRPTARRSVDYLGGSVFYNKQ